MELACNLGAIAAVDRPRYHELVARLRGAVLETVELADGYSLRLDMATADVEEWARMERLCCPFFAIEIRADGWLTLRGAKSIVEAELLASPRSEA